MPVKHAIFIEPAKPMRQYILGLKKRVAEWKPAQVYCDHPPHCTLIAGHFARPADWMAALSDKMDIAPFPIGARSWKVFPDDTLAGGGQTVSITVDPVRELFDLQLFCAETMRDYKIGNDEAAFTAGPLKESMDQYGFPFVGKHWIPHFTIASLRTSVNDLFLLSMTGEAIDFSQMVNEISVWEINNDEHKMIKKIRLNKR